MDPAEAKRVAWATIHQHDDWSKLPGQIRGDA
jgi:hypothetical protein